MGWFAPSSAGSRSASARRRCRSAARLGAASLPRLAAAGTRARVPRARRRRALAGAVVAVRAPARGAGARARDVDAARTSRGRSAIRACGCSAAAPALFVVGADRASPASRPLPPRAPRGLDARRRGRARRDQRARRSARASAPAAWSDRVRTRLRPLRAIGIALAVATAAVARSSTRRSRVLVAGLVVAGVLSLSWNGLAFAAAAETAGAGTQRRSARLSADGARRRRRRRPAGVRGARRRDVVAARVRARRARAAARRARARPRRGSASRQPREDAERRRSHRQLVELGVDAAELAAAVLVAGARPRTWHIGSGSRIASHRAEAVAPALGGAEQVEVDLDLVHLLHAARRTCARTPRTRRRTGTSARGTPPGRRPCRSAPRSAGTRPRPGAGGEASARSSRRVLPWGIVSVG